MKITTCSSALRLVVRCDKTGFFRSQLRVLNQLFLFYIVYLTVHIFIQALLPLQFGGSSDRKCRKWHIGVEVSSKLCGLPTTGGPPAWGLGWVLTILHLKKSTFYQMFHSAYR
jgi:hypothetical protein